jgi:hypothetical protein
MLQQGTHDRDREISPANSSIGCGYIIVYRLTFWHLLWWIDVSCGEEYQY